MVLTDHMVPLGDHCILVDLLVRSLSHVLMDLFGDFNLISDHYHLFRDCLFLSSCLLRNSTGLFVLEVPPLFTSIDWLGLQHGLDRLLLESFPHVVRLVAPLVVFVRFCVLLDRCWLRVHVNLNDRWRMILGHRDDLRPRDRTVKRRGIGCFNVRTDRVHV